MLVSVKNIIQFSGGFRPSDKEGGEAVTKKKKKKNVRPTPKFGLKIREEEPGPLTPPLDPPLQLNPSRRDTLGVPINGHSIEVPQEF